MKDKLKAEVAGTTNDHEIARGEEKEASPALWLGGGKRKMQMGGGRGPRTLEAYELVSWFFSRDGH